MSADDCPDCPVATSSRRMFLRDVGYAVVGALAAIALASPSAALAESVAETHPLRNPGRQRAYEIPGADSILVDSANEVILARWQGRVYAFSLKCPHRGTRLEWRPEEQRLFCPKHKARFQPNGSHESGRNSRDLDRHAVTRRGESILVDLDVVWRADTDSAAWRAAALPVA